MKISKEKIFAAIVILFGAYFFIGIFIGTVLPEIHWLLIDKTKIGNNMWVIPLEEGRYRIASGGYGSGSSFSIESNLFTSTRFLGLDYKSENERSRLCASGNVWMANFPEGSSYICWNLVNPIRQDAIEQFKRATAISSDENYVTGTTARFGAENFIYLGYVAQDMNEVTALAEALSDRSKVDLDANVETSVGTMYRLRHGVEKNLAKDPEDEDELLKLRATIPVMMERIHPEWPKPQKVMHVAYLDGHVEAIPLGEKFPATKDFIDFFDAQPAHALP